MFFILMLMKIIYISAKQNAVIFILCRNSDLEEIEKTLQNFETRFNNTFKYPYVFLNDEEFTEEFKEKLSKITQNNSKFGKIDPDVWNPPASIDMEKAKKNWKEMLAQGVPYADRVSYHNMCRFYSRSFYKHPLVLQYDYYWRIEPGVKFHCDIKEDPFEEMHNKNLKYGFVITIKEFMNSIKTLMKSTREFIMDNYSALRTENKLSYIYTNGEYNGCHFWSNFEIGAFDWLRSELYNKYMDKLEKDGGFYYERWGDAPVHSIAASFLLDKSQIKFFKNIGYTHDSIMHCPAEGINCDCKPQDSIDNTPYSCLKEYLQDNK